MKNHYRSFILPLGQVVALLVFIFFTYLFCMGSIEIVLEIMFGFLVLHIVYIVINLSQSDSVIESMKQSCMLFFYFLYLTILTAISPHNYAIVSPHVFTFITIISSAIFFYFLTRTEKNNREVIESSVRIYQAKKEDGV